MVEEPSHVKQLALNHVCKIGLQGEVQRRPVMLLVFDTLWFLLTQIFTNVEYYIYPLTTF
jgi:hypothetical protein